MKLHYNKTRTKRIWWDRYQKYWVMQNVDEEGNQIDGADYTCHRIYAFNWLNEPTQ